jgi:hypothetical protein
LSLIKSKNNNENIHAGRHLIIEELHQQCLEVSRTVLHDIVIKRLGCRKLCMRRVPKMLTDDHKKNCVAEVQAFLACYEIEGDDFLDYIMIC